MAFSLDDFINSNPDTDSTGNIVNLWISESIELGVTSSFVQGFTIPVQSNQNGFLENILREGSELVFEYYDDRDLETTTFYKSSVITRKKLEDYYYFKLKDDIQVDISQSDLGITSDQFFTLGFLPSNTEKFINGDYASIESNINLNRRSQESIKVDRNSYSPETGIYKGVFTPVNFEFINSIQTNEDLFNIPENTLSEIQDSNYDSQAWTKVRYDGVQETGILGNEPALSIDSFVGSIFPSSSTYETIRNIFSGSIAEVQRTRIYYRSYNRFTSSLSGSYYFESGSNLSNLLPYNTLKDNFYSSSPGKTFIYELVNSKLVRLPNSNIYKIDSGQIFTTDETGSVTFIL